MAGERPFARIQHTQFFFCVVGGALILICIYQLQESEIDEETMGILKKIRKKKSLLKLQQKSGVDLTSEEVIMKRITREHSV